jgi:hypothetical protein
MRDRRLPADHASHADVGHEARDLGVNEKGALDGVFQPFGGNRVGTILAEA